LSGEALRVEEQKPLKLDLGCGKNKKEGFLGVDIRGFDGVDVVFDLSQKWPWEEGSVEEVNCSHFVEHLIAPERIHFANELHRVLAKGAKATLIVPSWSSCRAYGDLTHQWPPVSEFWFNYLNKAWREANAPHNDAYTCDFDFTVGYGMHPQMALRNQEFQMFAFMFYKEAAQDIVATLIKK